MQTFFLEICVFLFFLLFKKQKNIQKFFQIFHHIKQKNTLFD
jgi:hypothetical protein